MKKIAFMAICALALVACAQTGLKFEPYEIPGLEPTPEWWKVKNDESVELCKSVKKGHSEIIAKTPAGFPVYAVFYGDFSEAAPETNWSAGNSSNVMSSYLGDTPEDKQTFLFTGGVHGAEPESIVAATNLIQMLETGKDFRGMTDSLLLDLCSKYRLIIVPCVNMDGRAISPDHLKNQPYEVFRKACQGTWKDGSLVGWKASKKHFPLPIDKVSFPGGYPNSEGYNIQHDVAPGDMRTEEAKAIAKLMARWRVDAYLNGHSCESQPHVIYPSSVETPAHIAYGCEITQKINDAFYDLGYRTTPRKLGNGPLSVTMNLTNLANWCSGGLGLTLELNSSGYDNIHEPTHAYSFDDMVDPAFVAIKIMMQCGLEKPLSCRKAAGV